MFCLGGLDAAEAKINQGTRMTPREPLRPGVRREYRREEVNGRGHGRRPRARFPASLSWKAETSALLSEI